MQHDQHGEPGCARDPRAPAEGEVRRRDEDRQGRCRERSHAPRCLGDDTEREYEPEHREDPERVPVAERAQELIRAARFVPEDVGKQASGQGVRRDGGDPGENPCDERSGPPTAGQQQERGHAGQVEESALQLEHRPRRALGPQDRKRRPRSEPRERGKDREIERPELHAVDDDEDGGGGKREPERAPSPRRGEVAAAGGARRQDRDRRESGGGEPAVAGGRFDAEGPAG
jgi:hypothetical protein